MHIIKNLKNFLMDQEYYIDIFGEYIHVYSYEELIHLSSDEIILKLKKFNLKINGSNLIVSGMDKQEILIKGSIDKLEIIR